MSNDIKRDPLDLLLRIQQAQAGEDYGDGSSDMRRGVGFELEGNQLFAAIDEVAEIVTCEEITKVPLAKPWVLGVTNVRGSVYTVVDLAGFFGFRVKAVRNAIHVISIAARGFHTCLRVSEVRGLKQLPVDAIVEDNNMHESLKPFIKQTLSLDDGIWGEFDIAKLAQHEEFAQVGISRSAA